MPPKSVKPIDKIDAIPTSVLRGLIELYQADLGSLDRTYPVRMSLARHERLKEFYSQWLSPLGKTSVYGLSQDGKIDYLLLKNYLEHELRDLEIAAKRRRKSAPIVPLLKRSWNWKSPPADGFARSGQGSRDASSSSETD